MTLAVGAAAPVLQAQPVFGPFVDSTALRRPLVVVFLRDVRSPMTRAAIADLTDIWPELDREGIGAVAVVQGSERDVRDFVPRHHVLFPVLHGDDALYAAWGVRTASPRELARSLAPSGLRQVARALETGMGFSTRGVAQLMAGCVIDPGGTLAMTWHGTRVTDAIPAADLRAAALASL